MTNTTTKTTNPVTKQVTERTYSQAGKLTRIAMYDAVEFGGHLINQTFHPKP